jgi:radical SAM superfamily enzyme YgiQ (UPF0313 family)
LTQVLCLGPGDEAVEEVADRLRDWSAEYHRTSVRTSCDGFQRAK